GQSGSGFERKRSFSASFFRFEERLCVVSSPPQLCLSARVPDKLREVVFFVGNCCRFGIAAYRRGRLSGHSCSRQHKGDI
ncbi:hypothetical protein XENOCAPTIV_015928, partial [Xenoophorus captivus]